jgi:hypothetical protein
LRLLKTFAGISHFLHFIDKMSETNTKITVAPRNPIVIAPSEQIRVTPRISNPIMVEPTNAIVISPGKRESIKISPSIAVTVKPPDRGAWDERGWTKRNDSGTETFEGFYQLNHKRRGEILRFRGRIQVSGWNGKSISIYILNPPAEVRSHKHGPCFQLIRDGWFNLHWSRPAKNVDDAILYMERVLDESING